MKASQVMADVGRRVTELRRLRGWTQEQFAERLRVDARTLQRIEAGKHVTFAMLVQLATALRIPVGDLFSPPVAQEPRRPGRPASVGGAMAIAEPTLPAERVAAPARRRRRANRSAG